MGAKIDQKLMQKSSPRWNASWHRFLSDFDGFLVPSWEGKAIKNRSKKASKKRCKKEAHQGGPEGALGPDNPEKRANKCPARGAWGEGREGGLLLYVAS